MTRNRPTPIQNVGEVQTVGLKVDTDFIDWGMIEPNGTKDHTIRVMPNGTASLTISFNTSNWSPMNASKYFVLSWNYSGVILEPLVWYPVEFNLYVMANVTGFKNFSFTIWLIGQEVIK